MTREEAIELLEDIIGFVEDNHGRNYDGAFRMAIESLQREEAEEKGWCHRIRPKNVEVVVRCKDCRHADECHKSVQYTRNEQNSVTIGYTKIDFCSHGERREE